MKKCFCVVLFFISSCYFLFAQSARNNGIESAKVKFRENLNVDKDTASEFCSRVSEIKRLPYKAETGVDEVYDGLIKAGDRVLPCLIDRVTDTTEMEDPRGTRMAGLKFVVGDLAYFMFIEIAKIDFTELLPDKVKESYKTEGVYAFHDFVALKKNRIYLQRKLDDWYSEKFAPYEAFEELKTYYEEADSSAYIKVTDAEFLEDVHYEDTGIYLLTGEVVESFKGNLKKGTTITFSIMRNIKTPLSDFKGETIYFLDRTFDKEKKEQSYSVREFTAQMVGERNLAKMRRLKVSFNRKSKI